MYQISHYTKKSFSCLAEILVKKEHEYAKNENNDLKDNLVEKKNTGTVLLFV